MARRAMQDAGTCGTNLRQRTTIAYSDTASSAPRHEISKTPRIVASRELGGT